VPLYLHPGIPVSAVRKAYFHGLPELTQFLLGSAGWGWHAETAVHVLRLALSGRRTATAMHASTQIGDRRLRAIPAPDSLRRLGEPQGLALLAALSPQAYRSTRAARLFQLPSDASGSFPRWPMVFASLGARSSV
jgi:hypothetical protein